MTCHSSAAPTYDPSVAPTKNHRGENFPVASALIAARHRPVILAYYRFARGADDIADHPSLSPEEKIRGLDLYEATLLGQSEAVEAARPLRAALKERNLSPRHALDLLKAFRMDAVKTRYASWDDLMNYCAFSAAPVGRFVLDVHGEDEATWPASDALCSALQVINHLQDCAADYRNLDRVYLPLDRLAARGIGPEALAEPKASEPLRAVLRDLAEDTARLIDLGATLPRQLRDPKLRLEIGAIARLARRLDQILLERDPLSQKVHLSKPAFLGWAAVGAIEGHLGLGPKAPRLAAPSAGRS
jgi:squalene synthase HpnC